MKNKHYLIGFIFLCLCTSISCNDSEFNKFSTFPLNYDLKPEEFQKEIIASQCMIDIFDSVLILTATPNKLKCIHFYNKNTFEYISSTGIIGSGPKEISSPGHCAIDKKNGIIWYRDLGNQCIWEFNIKTALNNENYLPESRIPIPQDDFFIFFEHENDSLFSFSNVAQDKLISFFNHRGEIIDSLTIYNTINLYKSEIPEQTRSRTATYFYEKDSQTNSYVFAYRFTNLIAKIDKNKTLKTISSDDKIQIPDKDNKLQIVANECLKVKNGNIFCLYSGQPKFSNINSSFDYNYPKTINIFNKDLLPVASLALEHPAMWFEVDPSNKRIITFSPETGSLINYLIPKEVIKKLDL